MSQRQGQPSWQGLRQFIGVLPQRLRQLWPACLTSSPPRRLSQRALTPLNWVIPGKLAVGALPQPGDRQRLEQANIKVILSLTAPVEADWPPEIAQHFRCARISLPDSRYTINLRVERLAKAVDLVHRSLSQQLPIYVHCLAGIERAPMVCIAYLCSYHDLDLWEAVNWLKQVRPCASPTMAQLQVVQELLQRTDGTRFTQRQPVPTIEPQPVEWS